MSGNQGLNMALKFGKEVILVCYLFYSFSQNRSKLTELERTDSFELIN